MACHLFGTKPLSELMLTYCQLYIEEKPEWNFYSRYKDVILENEFENVVWKMAVKMSQLQYVKNHMMLRGP